MTKRGNIYWLASYPKSGNTWMRILLANYFTESDDPVDINQLNTGLIASSRNVFDEYAGVAASNLTTDEIERLRPSVWNRISEDLAASEAPVFVKIHDALTTTGGGDLIVPATATAAAVYVMRNPLDVAVSFAHHDATTVATLVERMNEPEFSLVDMSDGIFTQLRQRLLTWSSHVTSWIDQREFRVHIVRYEDLWADPAAVFADVLRFVGTTPDPLQVAQAVRASSFDRVSAQEREAGFVERPQQAPSFFRAGKPDTWQDVLSPELVDKVLADHGPVMRRFGYELPSPTRN